MASHVRRTSKRQMTAICPVGQNSKPKTRRFSRIWHVTDGLRKFPRLCDRSAAKRGLSRRSTEEDLFRLASIANAYRKKRREDDVIVQVTVGTKCRRLLDSYARFSGPAEITTLLHLNWQSTRPRSRAVHSRVELLSIPRLFLPVRFPCAMRSGDKNFARPVSLLCESLDQSHLINECFLLIYRLLI